ncbi:MAG: polymer-forming cytoskeletal protein [Acidobacteriota bacterium]
MGKNSKAEEPAMTNYQNTPSNTDTTGYAPSNEPTTAASRVVSDSESIARDIKEGRLSGFVGHGTTLTGETNFQMMLRVDGQLTGSVTSEGGTLIVGTNGQVDANVDVASAMINGSVNGDISATERIQLGRTAKVVGNIQTPRLILEDGAILEGGCTMLKARDAQEKKTSEPKSSYSASSTTPAATPASSSSSYVSSSASTSTSPTTDKKDKSDTEATAGAAAL